MRHYHVAVVGSGPSGFFAAASLLKASDASDAFDIDFDFDIDVDFDIDIDVLEMLPTPWGLVRSGVAPDHPKITSISKQFEKTAQDPRFRFFGNLVVGEHVSAGDLAGRYDAVVYAVGAQSDRALHIPTRICGAAPAPDPCPYRQDRVDFRARELDDTDRRQSYGVAGQRLTHRGDWGGGPRLRHSGHSRDTGGEPARAPRWSSRDMAPGSPSCPVPQRPGDAAAPVGEAFRTSAVVPATAYRSRS